MANLYDNLRTNRFEKLEEVDRFKGQKEWRSATGAWNEQNFEDPLKSSRFFKKPDIVPYPYANFELSSQEDSLQRVSKARELDLLSQLESEKNLRKLAEDENDRLKKYLQDHQSSQKLSSTNPKSYITPDIDSLKAKLKILTEENDELRKHLSNHSDTRRLKEKLETEERNTQELLRELREFKDAYEELRKNYAKDVASQKTRFEELFNEKVHLEARLQQILHRFENSDLEEAGLMQEKIRNIKNDYREKVRELEKKIPENTEEVSDARLREIEARLNVLQGKLAQQSEYNERALARRVPRLSSRGGSPRRDVSSRGQSPYSTLRTFTGSPSYKLDTGRSSARSGKSPTSTARNFKDSNPSSLSRSKGKGSNSSKSPTRNEVSSPSGRSSSRLRQQIPHKQCETCIRKHGIEWACLS
jgi:DNA repair exonuclease SbcCD ATPase subunit